MTGLTSNRPFSQLINERLRLFGAAFDVVDVTWIGAHLLIPAPYLLTLNWTSRKPGPWADLSPK